MIVKVDLVREGGSTIVKDRLCSLVKVSLGG